MADIFISYAREDRPRAEALAAALEQKSWSVWWDRNIPTGSAMDDVIEHELASARCVIVLWSEASVRSGWVRAEASDAVDRGILTPVLLEEVSPPLRFRQTQAADLCAWNGDPATAPFPQLAADVARLLGPDHGSGKTAARPDPGESAPRREHAETRRAGAGRTAAEAAVLRLLEGKWPKRSFDAIKRRFGNAYDDAELRRILIEVGAVRFEGEQGQELWGLAERNASSLENG